MQKKPNVMMNAFVRVCVLFCIPQSAENNSVWHPKVSGKSHRWHLDVIRDLWFCGLTFLGLFMGSPSTLNPELSSSLALEVFLLARLKSKKHGHWQTQSLVCMYGKSMTPFIREDCLSKGLSDLKQSGTPEEKPFS